MAIDRIRHGNLSEDNEINWLGFHRAKVVDAHDLKKQGRVKVWIPDLMPETEEIDPCLMGLWAHPANNPLGGRNIQDMMGTVCEFEQGWYQGSCLIPPEGSWVWVFFENGDPNHPYYWGSGEFGQRKVLPENQQGDEWEKKWTLIKTKRGRVFIVSDDVHDERSEMTGKKRLISSPPDGDDASVYTIDANQTTILIDERPGKEKVLIKDYRGNYINLHTNDNGVTDTLDIYVHKDINIEAGAAIKIKSGTSTDIKTGTSYKLFAGTTIDNKATLMMNEQALMINRLSLTVDSRTALAMITDTATVQASRNAMNITDTAVAMVSITAPIINILAPGVCNITGGVLNLKGIGIANLSGSGTLNLHSSGVVNVKGSLTNIQMGVAPASIAVTPFPIIVPGVASTAAPAVPIGDRDQEPLNIVVPDPVIPIPTEPPLETITITIEGDPYDDVSRPPESFEADREPLPAIDPQAPRPSLPPPPPPPPEPIEKIVGVGHMFAPQLKDQHRRKIPSLVKESGGEWTGFYVLRDTQPPCPDYEYMDDIGVWNDYRNPASWTDWNTEYWNRLKDFMRASAANDLGVVVTLFDFCCSPNDPFITKIPYPYTSSSWKDEAQGEFVRKAISEISSTGADFIINLGCKSYNQAERDDINLLPSPGYLRKYINELLEAGVPSKQMALTANSNRNLHSRTPYLRYKTFTGRKAPGSEEINIEEYVDGHWGGTGRVAVYKDGNLVDGYVKYLLNSTGIPCMNTWKMSHFINNIPDWMAPDDPNILNYIFAPNQREAMRIVKGIEDDGFVHFTH